MYVNERKTNGEVEALRTDRAAKGPLYKSDKDSAGAKRHTILT